MDNPFELLYKEIVELRQEVKLLSQNNVIPASAPPEIIDEDALCIRLNITHPTAGRWRKKGKIPFLQIGSSIRYNWPVVISALENKKSKI